MNWASSRKSSGHTGDIESDLVLCSAEESLS